MQRVESEDHATLREAVRPYGKSPPGTVRGSCDARRQPAEEEARAAHAIEPIAHGGQARVFRCSIGGTAHDGFSKRLVWFDDPDTTLQALAHMKGYEHTAALREDSFARDHFRKLAVGNSFDNSRAGQSKSGLPVRFREEQHPRTSCGLRACEAGGVA